jgi:DNA polymerase-3 subunit gamma/tau
MPRLGRHCQAIMESRHIDVLEMDAASHTGIDDVREILDGVRYAPADARYKVYIIDEVHMLSDKAFNAFLKTLEEPPPHVKFIFATTEIRKVPVTVLSRCQRFDLRRVEGGLIAEHLAEICNKENVKVEPEVLGIVARAAEGSVRDALSLLDQAIAHGNANLKADEVRAQLGLADRARVIDLFEALMKGDIGAALANFRELYDIGADPAVIIADLAEFTHLVTRFKLVPSSADDRSLIEAERTRGRTFAEQLSVRVLSRAWQMLSKGFSEVQGAEKGAQAAEMVLVRLAFAADLPTPDEALRALREADGGSGDAGTGGSTTSGGSGRPGARLSVAANSGGRASAAPERDPAPRASVPVAGPKLEKFEDIVALAAARRDIQTKHAIEQFVRPVRMQDGRLEIALAQGAPVGFANNLTAKLNEWTGKRWVVILSAEEGAPTVVEQKAASQNALERSAEDDPLVRAVLQRFPGAKITSVKRRAEGAPTPSEPGMPDLADYDMPPDPPEDDDRLN